MIIRKFQAKTENEAILKAKEDMGGNAVVMNMKTVKPRGLMRLFKKSYVEVTAALDEEKDAKSNSGIPSVLDSQETKEKEAEFLKRKEVPVYNPVEENPILKEL